jgi:hypothetical protein
MFLINFENFIHKIVNQLKDLSKGNEDLVAEMLKTKMNEWQATLGPNEKEKLKEIDLDGLIEKLFVSDANSNAGDIQKERKARREKLIKERVTNKNNKNDENSSILFFT